MNVPSPEVIGSMIGQAIVGAIDNSARSAQKDSGILGPSDIGFCRQKAALVTRQVQPTDARASIWSAGVGTAVHHFVEDILRGTFPDWIIESERVTAVLPNGAEISGTPDIIIPEWNMVLDIKTVDGFAWVKREGTSQNHKYQRFLYADGACRAGHLDRDKPVWVANVYFDRSGKEATPHVEMEEIDWSMADSISEWLDDVIYAVKNDEDAQRDIPSGICEKICEFYTACRGGLPAEDSEYITDPETIAAIDMYVEGRNIKSQATKMMDAAKAVLTGVNGSTGQWQVRTTHIPGTTLAATQRAGYDKIEVVKVRTR